MVLTYMETQHRLGACVRACLRACVRGRMRVEFGTFSIYVRLKIAQVIIVQKQGG